jgi:hypothetical protein
MVAVCNEEIPNHANFPVKTAVLKINNIIIKEAYNYLVNMDTKMSTSIEDIPEVKTEYIDELRRENFEKADVVESKLPVPIFKEDLYEICSEEMSKEGVNYVSENFYLSDVKSLELVQIRIDKSDYIITEYCNRFVLEGEVIEVPPGNYSESEIVKCIQDLIDLKWNTKQDYIFKVDVTFQKNTECFIFSYKKSLLCQDKPVSKVINVDFSGKPSIAKLLGFEEKNYVLKTGESFTGLKHHLTFPQLVMFSIDFSENIKAQAIVPLNVEYNQTKFYDLEYMKNYKLPDDSLFKISNIKVGLLNERAEPYNTRGRSFSIRFKTTSLSY